MDHQLKFVVRAYGSSASKVPAKNLILTTDAWDDFGIVSMFHLSFKDEDGNIQKIGALKILQRTSSEGAPIEVASHTVLPHTFVRLDDNFISLGVEEDYYRNLHRIFSTKAENVLFALRDISLQPKLADEFEPTPAFRNSMMRENAALLARRFGPAWIDGRNPPRQIAFNYVGSIDGAEAPVEIHFPFDRRDVLPGRVVGIIGRNAVGKTRLLAKLGEDLAHVSRASQSKLDEKDQRFTGERPLFTRVIAISYSAFDQFKRPQVHISSSYIYCGIRSARGGLARSTLKETYRQNHKRIRDMGRQRRWVRHMRSVLGDASADILDKLEENAAAVTMEHRALSLLSSGQAILCHFVTALLAWIQPNSLVLFDEPETHLHPNAVANLFLVLRDILEEFDSYAVLATHSPVVIQEIPGKRVVMLRREGNITTAEPLAMESFGESIAELTRHVFEAIDVKSLYRETLKELAATEPPKEVIGHFEQGLSLNAQAFLLAQYSGDKSRPPKKRRR